MLHCGVIQGSIVQLLSKRARLLLEA